MVAVMAGRRPARAAMMIRQTVSDTHPPDPLPVPEGQCGADPRRPET